MCHKLSFPAGGEMIVIPVTGEITLEKHFWCCVLPKLVWTPAAFALWLSMSSTTQQLCSRLMRKQLLVSFPNA